MCRNVRNLIDKDNMSNSLPTAQGLNLSYSSSASFKMLNPIHLNYAATETFFTSKWGVFSYSFLLILKITLESLFFEGNLFSFQESR